MDNSQERLCIELIPVREESMLSRRRAKAYLLGVHLGDGCVATKSFRLDNQRSRFALVGLDLDLHNRARLCIERLFPHLRGHVHICHERNTKAGTPYYRTAVADVALANMLLRETGAAKDHLPLDNQLYEPTIFPEFVAGLMDTDGWIEHTVQSRSDTPRFMIGFANVLPWVFDFRRRLIQHGVKISDLKPMKPKMSMPWCQNPDNWNPLYRMTMKVQSFIDAGLFFRISRKRWRMYLRNWWCNRSRVGGRPPAGVTERLMERFELLKERVRLIQARRLESLTQRLMRDGVLYRRAENPQRPEARLS